MHGVIIYMQNNNLLNILKQTFSFTIKKKYFLLILFIYIYFIYYMEYQGCTVDCVFLCLRIILLVVFSFQFKWQRDQ